MKRWTLAAIVVALAAMTLLGGAASACTSESEEAGEHSGVSEREGSEGSGEEGGEEANYRLTKQETYDQLRAGSRLVISYDAAANAFSGAVRNTTESTLSRVRVEVHLSNGIELGPTSPVDLAPGESVSVTLAASEQPFDTWTAHAEVGPQGAESGGGEHGSESEGESEHGGSAEGQGDEHRERSDY